MSAIKERVRIIWDVSSFDSLIKVIKEGGLSRLFISVLNILLLDLVLLWTLWEPANKGLLFAMYTQIILVLVFMG